MTKSKPIVFEGSGSAIENYNSKKPDNGKNWGLFNKKNTKHLAVLSLLRQLGWTTNIEGKGEFADLLRLSDWLKSDKSPVKKSLLEMDNKTEVPKIITALESMLKKHYK